MREATTSEHTGRRGAIVWLIAALAWLLALACGELRAQDTSGLRVYQEELRARLDEQDEEAGAGLDAGGWATIGIFNFDDASGQKHTLRQYELRGWASLNVNGIHKFYFRGLTGLDDWNSGTNPRFHHGDEVTEGRVERAWYELNLGRWLSGQAAATASPFGARIQVGRAFAEIGTAFVLSMPLDMIKFEVQADKWEFMGLLGKSVPWTPDIDTSYDIIQHQDRCLGGFEVAYTGFDRHKPFAYFLASEDHSSPEPDKVGQKYDYSPRYVGVGSKGAVLLRDLRYQAELVGEFGQAYSEHAVSETDNICALGADLLFEYLFHAKTSPKVSFEYMFGSGDDDRRAGSSSTIGGNRIGTTDNAFNSFGFRDTGIAFAPRVSNMNIYVLGASFFPFENHKLLKKMELGSKTFFYQKDESGGPISDTSANTSQAWVGWEWDVYCDWRITSDMIWTVRYGAFQPGAAFDDQECRQFVFTGITYSF